MREMKCVDHLDFTGATCPDCGLTVDDHGNTESQFDYCTYPACGCDGQRLCMASRGPSERAGKYNVEGMYRAKSSKDRLAALADILTTKDTPNA